MKNKLTIVGVVLALILGVVAYTKPIPNPINTTKIQNVGALSGPDISSPYLAVAGLVHEYRSSVLATATNTPCAFLSPASTSTLDFAGLKILTGSSTATIWTLAKGTSAFSTSTGINSYSLGSGAQGTMFQTATSTIDGANVFGPSTYLVWTVQGTAIADATKFLGTCEAEFIVN